MSPFTFIAIDCIRIQDTASDLLETYGAASTERIARASGQNVKDVFAVMADLHRIGAVRFAQGLQVWILANE